MAKAKKDDDADLVRLRKQISEIRTIAEEETEQGKRPSQATTLNDFAQQIAKQFSEEKYSPAMMTGMFRLIDFLFLFAIGSGISLLYVQEDRVMALYMATIAAGSALSVLFLQIADCYQFPVLRAPKNAMPKLLSAWALAFAAMALTLFFFKTGEAYSRFWFGAWFLAGALYLVAERFFLAWGLRRWIRNGVLERRAVIVCGGQPAQDLIRSLESQEDNDIRILGVFDDRLDRRSPDLIAGYPKLGTVAELVEFVRIARVDMLIVSLPMTAEKRILDVLRKLWILPVDIRLAAHANKLKFRPRAYSHVGKMADARRVRQADHRLGFSRQAHLRHLLQHRGDPDPVAGHARRGTGRQADLASGPIIFKQKRHGFNNETINVFKFRSMYTDLSRCDGRQCGDQARSARDAGRPFPAQVLDRRIAAAFQRVEGRSFAGRSASARRSRPEPQPRLCRCRGRLFRPPPGQARRHRLGADQWLARRDRYRREDQASARPMTSTISRTGRCCSISRSCS